MALFGKKQSAADGRLEALEAEYRNYRRRTVQEMETVGVRSAQKTAAVFLQIYDDLQRALNSTCSDPAFYQGIEMIQKNLLAAFSSLDIRPMDSKGKIFNPDYHEAVEQISDPRCRAGEITEVLQTGFTMDEEVIRHAKVIVANCE